jgi:hypothetical protein
VARAKQPGETVLRLRTLIEKYRDGHRELFHRTATLVFTHPDTQKAREACEVCIEESADSPALPPPEGVGSEGERLRPHKLDAAALELFAATADPAEFDKLRKLGWPGMAAHGNQLLAPCGPECGVCNPTIEITERARRAKRRRK